ncbi:gamma-glutamyltranspeptidase / glutathione hydrolase [Pseudorhodobacter antarcticus]|uniref:Gamma-glutamyltranspeptidase / glutathione hydrolase n=1 Tax=Pseudorhodobacter antarcticus TaxID=1077947 RepID=A0A1H8K999_9RHOB|nr:gamma-glutamyltranspeptidase / glutathione hydrolase [Pseudorhodobacter antarcticus]
MFHTEHFQSSFYPRAALPGEMTIEPSFGEAVIDDLRARGHIVTVAPPMTVGRLTAAIRDADGSLLAGATPRLMQAYAVGR